MTGPLTALTAICVCCISTLAGCDGADRRDAETVIIAVGRFRTADNASTPSAVEALRNTPCNAADACAAKDACFAAGDATSKALVLKAEVQKSISALEKGEIAKDSLEAKNLSQKLDDAEKLLKQGHDGLSACDEKIQGLKRKYRI